MRGKEVGVVRGGDKRERMEEGGKRKRHREALGKGKGKWKTREEEREEGK